MNLAMNTVFKKSENVVFRKIEDEYILVPMVASAADVESIFNLNETGAEVWERIDGKRTLQGIIDDLSREYDAEAEKIKTEVLEFINDIKDAGIIEVL
jgi:coenzyme PQQ biosynthesis protein PqqD